MLIDRASKGPHGQAVGCKELWESRFIAVHLTEGRWHRAAWWLVVLVIAGAMLTRQSVLADNPPCPLSAETESTASTPTLSVNPASDLGYQWGIQVASLRLTANGNLLDFRYRVIDPDKASRLANRSIKAYLTEQESGKTVTVPSMPKVGALRQTAVQLKKNRIYFVLFSNPGRFIKAGNRVTVTIGDFKTENLIVE